MKERDIGDFKIGEGGGSAVGAPGKEATVYVGSKDDAVAAASRIEEELGKLLLPPAGDTLSDDIQFTVHVMGRFEILGWDLDFIPKGFRGFPMLCVDARRRLG
jgi:hypothetical protein